MKDLVVFIKKETEYAILGLVTLAQWPTSGYVELKTLAGTQQIPESLLSKVFQKLASSDIIESKFGPNGGFRLKKDSREITLWEIFRAVQVPTVLKCYAGKAPYCIKPDCPLRQTVGKIESYLQEYLANTTLNELACKIKK